MDSVKEPAKKMHTIRAKANTKLPIPNKRKNKNNRIGCNGGQGRMRWNISKFSVNTSKVSFMLLKNK